MHLSSGFKLPALLQVLSEKNAHLKKPTKGSHKKQRPKELTDKPECFKLVDISKKAYNVLPTRSQQNILFSNAVL